MDFWVDMAFAVLIRLLKDKDKRGYYLRAFAKVYNEIGIAFNIHHVYWSPDERQQVGP